MNLIEKVKVLMGISSQFDKIKAGPKAGIKSTEFWATALVSLYATLSPVVPEPYNIIIPSVATSLYVIARAAIKIAHDMGIAKNVDELPETVNTDLASVSKDQ